MGFAGLSGAAACLLLADKKKQDKSPETQLTFPQNLRPASAPPPRPVESPIQATQRDQASAPQHDIGIFSDPVARSDPTTAPQHDSSPVCIFPDQVANTAQIFTYKCSTFSRRNPVILNVLNQPLLNVRSKAFTMTRERQLRNAADTQILMTIHRQIWTAGPPYYTFLTTSGVELLRLDRRWQYGTSRMVASFTNTLSGQQQRLIMDGDWSSINTTVRNSATNALLAEFRLNLLIWKQTYTVIIQPGVDVALMIGMLICFDDREGHDFHVARPQEMKLAWRKDREHAAQKKRQGHEPGACPGGLDGSMGEKVRKQRKALERLLHRREKRFRGPGQHLISMGPDREMRKAQNAASVQAVRDAELVMRDEKD